MKTSRLPFITKPLFALIFFLISFLPSFSRQDSTRYPLVLNFYSIGTGTPGDQPLKDFVSVYRKQNKLPSLSATKVAGLGREGEYAIIFPLTELNLKQKKEFTSALSKALPTLKSKEEMGGINLDENQPFDTSRGRLQPQKMVL